MRCGVTLFKFIHGVPMRSLLKTIFLLISYLPAPAAFAECAGQNLLAQMPIEEKTAIFTRAEAEPFATGNFWTAQKDGQTVTLVGTYHLGDPRHDKTMAAISPLIAKAKTVLVEAGPEEEKALVSHLAKNPDLMVLTDTSLPELLSPSDWNDLSKALQTRGIPGFMAAKFQPWYVSLMLGTPPCDLKAAMQKEGLDALIIQAAQSDGVPVKALEPFDTVFQMFDQIPLAEQIDMIRYSLGMEDRIEDFSATLADVYFDGDSRVIWELMCHESYSLPGATQAEVDADLSAMEEAMMVSRNEAWIPVIESAAAGGNALAAFGALHLSGQKGVANLLALRGWTLKPLTLPTP